MQRLLHFSLMIIVFATHSCKMKQAASEGGYSGLSDLSVNLPGNLDTNGKVLFDVYSIEIKASTTAPECLASQIVQGDVVTKDTSKSLALRGISVKRSCDYLLVVDLGIGGLGSFVESKLGLGNHRKIVADKRTYSSNVSGKGGPISVLAADMQKAGKSYRVPQVVVYKVNANGVGPEELKPGEDADLDIDIKIGDEALPKLSLSIDELAQQLNLYDRGLENRLVKGQAVEIKDSAGFNYFFDSGAEFYGDTQNSYKDGNGVLRSIVIRCANKSSFRQFHVDNLKGAKIKIAGEIEVVSQGGQDLYLSDCTFQK